MLIRFSLLSSNPITLLDTVHPLSDTKPKIGKSRKIENPDLGRSAPPHTMIGHVAQGAGVWVERAPSEPHLAFNQLHGAGRVLTYT